MNSELWSEYLSKSPFQIAASLSASVSGLAVSMPALPRVEFFNLVVVFVLAYFFLLWVTLVYWAWRDTQNRLKDRRWRRLVLLLVALFNVPGLMIYLLLRPPTFQEIKRAKMEEEVLKLEWERLRKKKDD